MAKHTKYGFCPITKRWVPRDKMLAVHVRAYDEDDNEERIRMRLSPVGYQMLTKYMRENAWTGVLKEEQELFPNGLSDEDRDALVESVSMVDETVLAATAS